MAHITSVGGWAFLGGNGRRGEEGRVELSELTMEMCCLSTGIMLNLPESKTSSQFPHFALQLSFPASQLCLLLSFDAGLSSCHGKVLQSVLSTVNLASPFQFKKSLCYTFEMDQKCKPEAHQRLRGFMGFLIHYH